MKKSLFIILFMSGIFYTQAQCTITPGCTIGATGYCTTPATGTSLPNATELMGYSTTIQVSLGTTAAGGAATITDATVTAVSGLPTGLSYSVNPTSGVIAGGSSGCLLFTGTPAAGTAGNYTITVNITANTNFGPFPQMATWLLTVDGTAAGINQLSIASANTLIMPNPANNSLTVNTNILTDNSNIQVIDMLGNNLMQTNLQQGKVTLDVSNLQQGVYFIIVNKRIQKFIKQ
ncbi:MAG: T9SS type A sorting domain-containing protein [Bacteroidia bacterium]